MNQYKVLVVGMGKRGMHHATSFNVNPKFQVVGICDIDQKRLDDAFTVAERADVVDRQQKPEHQWKIHPLIDGCLSSGLHASDPMPDLH